MIYYVTNNVELIPNDYYKIISVSESLEILNRIKIIGVDTETSGLEVYSSKLLLVQLGNFDNQVVIDTQTISISLYKEFLERTDKLFIFQNAKFDLKYFIKHNIIFNYKCIYDTFIVEKVLYLGYPSLPKNYSLDNPEEFHTYNLKDIVYRYCGVILDKTQRGQFIIDNTITTNKIIYGANDVKYLEAVMNKQLEQAKKDNLIKAVTIENSFVIIVAYMEYCGVKLDRDKWAEKASLDRQDLEDLKTLLDDWILKNNISQWITQDLQGDLFNGFDTQKKCIINWDSPKQIVKLFKSLGINVETKDKKKGTLKDSVENKLLESQKSKCSLIPLYLTYKEKSKLVSTYGFNIINLINPITGRLHTNFNQIGTTTGRLSSGGKDNNINYINFQNFPNDELTRSCFISENSNDWISADYSGQESRVIACLSKDKAMLDLFKTGCGDVHSLTAKMSYPDLIEDTAVEEIKSKFHELRNEAKGIEFAINYGGNASTISGNKGIPIEEATTIYNNYMKGFKGIKEYQDKQREFVKTHNYIILNDLVPYRRYIPNYNRLQDIKKDFTSDFWDYYKIIKNKSINGDFITNVDNRLLEKVKYYFKEKSNIEKYAINSKCQGSGAVMLKIACILFWKYLIKNNLLNKVKILILAHDKQFVVYKLC